MLILILIFSQNSKAMRFKHLLLGLATICSLQSYGSIQWTQRADFPASARHRAVSASAGNMGYVGLGHYNGTGFETYFNDWWEFDPSTNAWTQKADYPGNNGLGELGARVISLETVCYVGLGELDHTSLFKYDPATNLWTQVSSPPPSNQFRDTQDMVVGHKAYFTDLWGDELYEYDCDLDVWTFKGMLPLPWYFVFSAFSHDGMIFVKAYNEIWRYNPAMNNWNFINFFPGTAELASVAFVQHDKAYIVCGHGTLGSDVTSEVWQFDPVTYVWTQFDDFPGTSRRYSTGFTIGDRCYLSTGTNGTNFKDLWEFNSVAGVGVDEVEATTVEVYPNPVMESVMFNSENSPSFEVTLTDLNGKQVAAGLTLTGSVQINRNGLPAGAYIYTITVDGKPTEAGQLVFQ